MQTDDKYGCPNCCGEGLAPQKKKASIAHRIRIRGSWWKVIVKQLGPCKKNGKWVPTHGLCCYKKREIYLNPQFRILPTLIHEITHACQPDLDECSVEEIEDALISAFSLLKKIEKCIAKTIDYKKTNRKVTP